ncbi:TetR family transcriptional regulator C-terminal domain-containing protein [Clostridium felsineum]|uniref:TetR/AcrR family transcriptional regulator n=1 Tax=Clostridium felsineum TaxID=36839 RepID=UPI00098C94B6|nr:TetR-like C-terminal domain-containing protein [Clostridium felsineum]MCR3759005.1 TetR family transcriptional regulator C-terminal domain-containing protein [Clostridium felsineum]URZ16606.1 hypothetical protein CLFE_026530 [Clostridium felsineum DSM 794]
MKKVDRRIQKTKEAICNAFVKLIKTKEYKSITITELADMANIDRKTFYLHYTAIDDVLEEFGLRAAEKVRILLKSDRPFKIENFLKGLTKIMEEDISFYRNISNRSSYSFFLEECKNILKNSLKESFYLKSGFSEDKLEVYVEYISSGIIGIYTNWLSSNSKMELGELTDLVIDAVIGGWTKITYNEF